MVMGALLSRRGPQVHQEQLIYSMEALEIATRAPPDQQGKTPEEYMWEMIGLIYGEIYNLYHELPGALLELIHIASTDEGLCRVVHCLVNGIPLQEPLAPLTLVTIFHECPLAASETFLNIIRNFRMGTRRALDGMNDSLDPSNRNLMILVGCIAEKLSTTITNQVIECGLLDFIYAYLTRLKDPEVITHALIALEKFSRNSVNKTLIVDYLHARGTSPLRDLEARLNSNSEPWRQVGFIARWLLDNVYLVPGRVLSHVNADMSNINVLLDQRTSSDHLKISPNGLEARSDVYSYENVKGSFSFDRGCWYYEVEVHTAGVMQIGWSTEDGRLNAVDDLGFNQGSFWISYDGCRRNIWHKDNPALYDEVGKWKAGDVIGCLIDVARQQAVFYRNGNTIDVCYDIFFNTRIGQRKTNPFVVASERIFPAASFLPFQAATFNFGRDEFMFPPTDREFMILNDVGKLPRELSQVVPRWMFKQQQQQQQASDSSLSPSDDKICVVCISNPPDVVMVPCLHCAVCRKCLRGLNRCPMCRSTPIHIIVLPQVSEAGPPRSLLVGSPLTQSQINHALNQFDVSLERNTTGRCAASFLLGLAELLQEPADQHIASLYRVFNTQQKTYLQPEFEGRPLLPNVVRVKRSDDDEDEEPLYDPPLFDLVPVGRPQWVPGPVADSATPEALVMFEEYLNRDRLLGDAPRFRRFFQPAYPLPSWSSDDTDAISSSALDELFYARNRTMSQ